MGALIKTLVTALIGGTMVSLPTIIRRVLISLGFGVAVFTGSSALMAHIKSMAFGSVQGMPSLAANIAGILNIDVAFSIVMSAYAIKLTLRTLGSLNPKQIGLF
jgi:predicted membrane-bound spermidine synthase